MTTEFDSEVCYKECGLADRCLNSTVMGLRKLRDGTCPYFKIVKKEKKGIAVDLSKSIIIHEPTAKGVEKASKLLKVLKEMK